MPCKHTALCFVLLLSACTSVELDNTPPVAVAGTDRSLESAGPLEVTLDGSESSDPDGTVVDYEWRYGGPPPEPEDEMSTDAGTPLSLLEQLLEPLPAFCPEMDPDSEALLPVRHCLIESDGGDGSEATVTLEPGAYRFTLRVRDNDGATSADTVVITVTEP